MIVALEGPDCCGKSSVFDVLQQSYIGATFVPRMPMCKELVPVMSFVEHRQAELWRWLYVPSTLYICDRCVFSSAPVYDRLYNRPLLVDIAPWRREVKVVYLDVPIRELQRRYDLRGDDLFDPVQYAEVRKLYSEVLVNFEHIRIDGTGSVGEVSARVADAIRSFT